MAGLPAILGALPDLLSALDSVRIAFETGEDKEVKGNGLQRRAGQGVEGGMR